MNRSEVPSRTTTREFARGVLKQTLTLERTRTLKQAITSRRITLLIAGAIVAVACSKSRAELEQEYINACIMLGEHQQSICECTASKAGNELSPQSLALLVVTVQGDEEHAARLRDRMGIVEVMAAGTFIIDGPARCAREAEAR